MFNLVLIAVGACLNHFSALSMDLYNDLKTKIYVDSTANAATELKDLNAPIAGQAGDIIYGYTATPSHHGITIFQSF